MLILGNKEKLEVPLIQQGDCVLKVIGVKGIYKKEFLQIPTDAKKLDTSLVLKGDTNSHALYSGKFEVLKSDSENRIFLKVTEPCYLDHVKDHNVAPVKAEHHAQWIPVGEYFSDDLLEYNHITEESKRIVD